MTTNYLVDTQNLTGYAQVMEELQGGAVARSYTWGHWLLSKQETGSSQLSFYGYDGHGSVRFLTDSTETVTDTYDYDAFGNLINQTGTTLNNYLFAGEAFDPVLGLYYNRARYLNTNTGRFWTMDDYDGSNVDPPSLHKYVYVENDPLDNADPSGNQIDDIIAGIGISEVLDALPTVNFATVLQSVPREETLYLRAFAPWKTFGFGFKGDDRGFTTRVEKGIVTSRVNGIVKFLAPSLSVLTAPAAYSDTSCHPLLGCKTGNPTITATGGGGKMEVEESGSLPLIKGAPPIVVKLVVSGQQKGRMTCYKGNLRGTAFPDVEAFVVNGAGQTTVLDDFTTKGGRETGPYIYLQNPNQDMGGFSACAPN